MAYDLSYIRNRVLEDKLDDVEFDPGVADNFINDAQRSIFNSYELPFQEKVFNGTVPLAASIVNFPSDYQVAQSMVLKADDGTSVDITYNYLEFREFNKRFPAPDTREAGKPTIWTSYGDKLYLSQPTDQNYTLSLFYLKTPAVLEDDSDIPEIPEEFQEVLVLGAYYRILERNEDFDQAAFVKNGDYADEVAKMLNRLAKRQAGKPHLMSAPGRVQLRAPRRS